MSNRNTISSGFVWLPVLLGILAVLVLGGAYVYETQKPTVSTEPIYTPTTSTNTTKTTAPSQTAISAAQAVSLLYNSPEVKQGYSTDASSLYCGDNDYTEDDQYYYFSCSVLMPDGHRVAIGKFAVDKFTGSIQ